MRRVLILLVMISMFASGYVTPMGISGRIYSLSDPSLPVPTYVMFSINNTANRFFISDNAGKPGVLGFYSAAVPGQVGDMVEIRAWTPYRQTSLLVELDGSMRNVNLLLDLSVPTEPPRILSVPPSQAHIGELYEYEIVTDQQVSYRLVLGPPGMEIESGTLRWIPVEPGVFIVAFVVKAENGLSARQIYYITVQSEVQEVSVEQALFSQMSKIDDSFIYEEYEVAWIRFADSTLVSLSSPDVREVSIVQHNEFPEDLNTFTEGISYLVFRVFWESEYDLSFRVDKEFIKKNFVDANRINLYKYVDEGWSLYGTQPTSEDERYYYFVSKITEGTYLISAPVDEKRYYAMQDIDTNSVPVPVVVSGKITKFGIPVEGEVTVKVGGIERKVPLVQGRYYSVLSGNQGENVVVVFEDEERSATIQGTALKLDFELGNIWLISLLMTIPVIAVILFLIKAVKR